MRSSDQLAYLLGAEYVARKSRERRLCTRSVGSYDALKPAWASLSVRVGGHIEMEIASDVAERIRTTDEGAVIEDLIDAFFA